MSHKPSDLDAAMLERLYCRLEKAVYNTVYRWVWDEEDAHDIVQEAFVKLWKIRHRVDVNTVEPLIYRIAINLASNRRRWRKVRHWISLESAPEQASSAPDPELRLLGRERALEVRDAVEGLPEKYRRVIMLCEFSELTYEEIANTLEIAPGTVGSRRNTALQKLRTQLCRRES